MSTTKRILLAWPIFQALYPRPFERFASILVGAGRQTGYVFGLKVYERMSLVHAMNSLGETVLRGTHQHGTGWDAAIVFDDDCFPPVDVVPRLLARCFDEGHAFVAATGLMRGYPFTTTVAKYYEEGVTAIHDGKKPTLEGFYWLDQLPEQLAEVDFCGVPAAIIHRRVFERTTPPWFGDSDPHGQRMTHDVYFCNQIKKAGFPVMVDGTIRCGHLLDAPVISFDNREAVRGMGAEGV